MFKSYLKAKTPGISPSQMQNAKNYIVKRYFQKQLLSVSFGALKRRRRQPTFGDMRIKIVRIQDEIDGNFMK